MTESEKKKLYEVTLGALLHDIGKFMQRAEVEKQFPEIEKSYGEFCPLDEHGKPGYLHAAHTAYFIEHFLPEGLVDKTALYNAARHHKNPAGELFRESDCLSSGMERHKEESSTGGIDHYKKVRLHSILEYLSIEKNRMKSAAYRHELNPLDNSARACFAEESEKMNPVEGTKLNERYAGLWRAFLTEFTVVATGSTGNFIVSLLGLLEKYTWCIPSSAVACPDISLFDHAKTTAAIAAALHLYHTDKGEADVSQHDETKKFVLLSGDLSGIQNYIFNISNVGIGGTAKRLRARSFFLSTLSDIAAHRLLHAFSLSPANLIISSGGKFYLLLPNINDCKGIIDNLRAEFDAWLMENLNGEVALNLATTPFSCGELLAFDRVLKQVNEELNRVKSRTFGDHLTDGDDWLEDRFLIKHRGFTDEESLCKGCGKFAGQIRDGEVVLCDHCDNDVKLGRELAKAVGVQFFNKSDAGKFKALGYSYTPLKIGECHDASAYLVNQFNDWNFNRPGAPLRPRYFANHVPLFEKSRCPDCDATECKDREHAEAGNPKFFTCLAQASRGRKVLGVFKADVDNLGLIFINGFQDHEGKTDKSISRITTLSRLLDTFFTGRLDHLLRMEFKDVYTVYAGGDDLLVLGPWNEVVNFSIRLREEFSVYCCRNPDFTLSAGIAVVKPRLPVYAAIDSADLLLESAKKNRVPDEARPKNQICALGDSFKWDGAEAVLADAERLAGWQEQKKVSMSFVRQLLSSGEMYRRFRGTGNTRYLRFAPLLAYSIARNIPAKEAEIVKWAQDLTDIANPKLKNLTFIANYSIHINRS